MKILLLFTALLLGLPAMAVYRDGVLYLKIDEGQKTCRIDQGVDVGDTLIIPSSVMFDDIEFSVTEIGDKAFYESKLRSVTIPSSVKSIGESAFEKSLLLESVELSAGLLSIGERAFGGCVSLAGIDLPESLESVGDSFLAECSGLEGIYVNESNPYYSDIDGVLFNKDISRLVQYPGARSGSYAVPSTVLEIGAYAFYSHNFLEGVTLPEELEAIGKCAFSNCPLTSVEFPLSLKEIGEMAFSNCSLKEAIVPEGVRVIKDVFEGNATLETVRMYGGFDEVSSPFDLCSGIREVYYITDELQADNGGYVNMGGHQLPWFCYVAGSIDWGFLDRGSSDVYWEDKDLAEIRYPEATLYVLSSVYDKIKNDCISPWSYFKHIEIYDPSGDPYVSAVDDITEDFTPQMSAVYTLGGLKVSDSTEGLRPGFYIVRRGDKVEKIVVR